MKRAFFILIIFFIMAGCHNNETNNYIDVKIINNYYSDAYVKSIPEGNHTFTLCDTFSNRIFILFDPTVGSGINALANFRNLFSLPLSSTAKKILVPGSTISFVIPAVGYTNPSFLTPLLSQSFYLEPDLLYTSIDWVQNTTVQNIIGQRHIENSSKRDSVIRKITCFYSLLERYVRVTDSLAHINPQISDLFGSLFQAVTDEIKTKTSLIILSDAIVNLPKFNIVEREVIKGYRNHGASYNSNFDWDTIKSIYPLPENFHPEKILLLGVSLEGSVQSAVKDLFVRFYSRDNCSANGIKFYFNNI